MSAPDVACLCVDRGIWSALTISGDAAGNLIGQFLTDHSGPGHIPETPPRDWYGKEAALKRHLERTRKALSASQGGS